MCIRDSYDTIEGSYDSSIFTAEKHALTMDKAYKAQKAIQDYVFTDGTAEKSVAVSYTHLEVLKPISF